MRRQLRVFVPLTLVFLSFYGIVNASTRSQTGDIYLAGPTECPGTGCAAGQRLNFTAEFSVGEYNPDNDPNVDVCFFTPTQWKDTTVDPQGMRLLGADGTTTTGGMTGKTYQLDGDPGECNPPSSEYAFLGRARATLGSGVFGDYFGLSFRINPAATNSGAVVVQLYERTGSGGDATWKQTRQFFKNLTIKAAGANVFVANDAAACGGNTPCYVNSSDDFGTGYGTGLKDAVDAVASGGTITVLGNYTVKNQTVLIDRAGGDAPLTLRGTNDASIVSAATTCDNPMLDIRTGIKLTGLNIQGGCSTAARDLVHLNSATAMTLESNDLTGGKDAVVVGDTAGSITLRFNNISGNTGYALQAAASSGSAGGLSLVANNLAGNRGGAQVECNQRGSANHNYWGVGALASTSSSNCTVSDAKRLGSAIQANSGGPGVNAVEVSQVPAGPDREYAFGGQIGYRYNGGASTFGLYIINHGPASTAAIPFTTTGLANVTTCGNYWDVFLKDGASLAADASLDLFVKYDSSSACQSAVESSVYCARTSPGPLAPLWWLDPSAADPLTWALTASGSNPQETSCDTAENELKLTVDGTGRPNFANDLFFTPLLIGTGPLATVTPSLTTTATITQTSTITPTRTNTLTPTKTLTRTPTRTRTATRTYTPYVYRTSTSAYRTPTPVRTKTLTPNPQTRTAQAKITPSKTIAGTSSSATDNSGYPAPEGTASATLPAGTDQPTQENQATDAVPGYPADGTEAAVGNTTPGASEPGTATATLQSASSSAIPGYVATITPTVKPVRTLRPPTPTLGFWARLGAGGLLGTIILSLAGWGVFVRRTR